MSVDGHMTRTHLAAIAGVVFVAVGAAGLIQHASGLQAQTANPSNRFAVPVFAPDEKRPGGAATARSTTIDANAFSHASGNLTFKREFDFKLGNAIFRKLWVSSPASTKASDGLGPLYNARSCQRCHLKDGRGHPPTANWPQDDAVSMLIRLSVPPGNEHEKDDIAKLRINSVDDPIYGGQLQDFAIPGHSAEGRIHIEYDPVPVKLADGTVITLQKPRYKITHLGYGPLRKGIMLSPRIASPMIGLGLLEAIPAQDIRALADPDDRDRDGISGRPNEVWSLEHDRVALGRFGWKAGQPSIAQQVAKAFAGDIGISSPLVRVPSGDCTYAQMKCNRAPNGENAKNKTPEINQALFDLVAFYAANLAVPRARRLDDPEVQKGRALFYRTGCAACHRPSYMTGEKKGQRHLSGQKIWPYTDLLLHDMGDGLADNRPEARANGREWRTAPLWGIGLTKTVNGHTRFLHDGRARNLLEAILWHDGEAETARRKVMAMDAKTRALLLKFLNAI